MGLNTHRFTLDDYIQVEVPPNNFSFDLAFRVFDHIKSEGETISRGIFSSFFCQIRANVLDSPGKSIVGDSGRGCSLPGTIYLDLVSSLLGRHCPQANTND